MLWRESYTPFGESLNDPVANRDNENFTGHIRDTNTGLIYMQARYMDPVVGRFLSNDPVGFAEGGVAYFNRYSYTANNPVNAWDPTGLYPVDFQFLSNTTITVEISDGLSSSQQSLAEAQVGGAAALTLGMETAGTLPSASADAISALGGISVSGDIAGYNPDLSLIHI